MPLPCLPYDPNDPAGPGLGLRFSDSGDWDPVVLHGTLPYNWDIYPCIRFTDGKGCWPPIPRVRTAADALCIPPAGTLIYNPQYDGYAGALADFVKLGVDVTALRNGLHYNGGGTCWDPVVTPAGADLVKLIDTANGALVYQLPVGQSWPYDPFAYNTVISGGNTVCWTAQNDPYMPQPIALKTFVYIQEDDAYEAPTSEFADPTIAPLYLKYQSGPTNWLPSSTVPTTVPYLVRTIDTEVGVVKYTLSADSIWPYDSAAYNAMSYESGVTPWPRTDVSFGGGGCSHSGGPTPNGLPANTRFRVIQRPSHQNTLPKPLTAFQFTEGDSGLGPTLEHDYPKLWLWYRVDGSFNISIVAGRLSVETFAALREFDKNPNFARVTLLDKAAQNRVEVCFLVPNDYLGQRFQPVIVVRYG